MAELYSIDIVGKSIALSGKELRKLTEPEGCQLQVVTDKVLKLDEGDYDDDDYNSDGDGDFPQKEDKFNDDYQDESEATTNIREDRMRREYVSLILNADNDPIKPGSKFKSVELYQDSPTASRGHDFDLNNLEEKYIGIHRMYENVGKFDDYMRKNSFVEISPGLVHKMTRVPGIGDHALATENSLIMYNCALWTEGSREPFDSTWLRRKTLMVLPASDSILPGLKSVLLSCQQRELCEAFIRPEAAYGPLGAMPRIPPNATVFCLLEVVRVVSQDKFERIMRGGKAGALEQPEGQLAMMGGESVVANNLSPLKFEDFFEASDEARRRGNYFYEREQYRVALQRYKSAIRLLEGFSYGNEQEEARAKELLVKLYNNCARTSNAMGNPRGALGACKQASLIDNLVPKTYWHRMSAWAKKGHLDRALGVARRAIQLFPDPMVSKPFMRAAQEFKLKMQQEQGEVDKLHRLMGQALISSA